MEPNTKGRRTLRLGWPELAVLCIPAVVVLGNLTLPLQEDALFWWVPHAAEIAESGPRWAPSGDLPEACKPGDALPGQWRNGLPDYGHPPLWFHYLALFMALIPNALIAVRVACLAIALGIGWGVLRISRCVVPERLAPILAAMVLIVPAVGVQWVRPDTDLGLMLGVVWTLVFVLESKPLAAACVAALAVWVKEPGVLLAVPMFAAARRDPRFLGLSLAPVGALLFWGWTHAAQVGWAFAESERLPDSISGWLSDLLTVGRLIAFDGGRWVFVALAGLAVVLVRWRAQRLVWPKFSVELGAFLLAWWLALGTINFLGGREVADNYTHLRYFLPAIIALVLFVGAFLLENLRTSLGGSDQRVGLVLLGIVAVAFLPGSRSLGWGPESSWYGRDLARVTEKVHAHRANDLGGSGKVWVGSYLFVALTRPYAGGRWIDDRLKPFSGDTRPEDLAVSDGVLHASYGEPLSRLNERVLEPVWREQVGHAWVEYAVVRPGRAAPPPKAGGAP